MGDNRHLEVLTKSVRDMTGSIAALQKAVDDLKSDMNAAFQKQAESREEHLRHVTARVAAMGNHVSYLRETICSTWKEGVSAINQNATGTS